MKTDQIIAGVVGAVVTGFLFGVGFELAKRTMNRQKKSSARPEHSSFNGVQGWGGDNWLTDEKATALDNTNGLNQSYYGADGVDQYDYVNAPQPFRPQPQGFDFTTGQQRWS